jgi:hypothetical protein
MKAFVCELEAEVLGAVLESHWPDEVEPSLREHVPSCIVCSDVVAIAASFDIARQHTHSAVVVPDASRIWWFAQLRARREAAQEAARPIFATQIAAFAWAMGLIAVCVGTALTWFQVARGWLWTIVAGLDSRAIFGGAMTALLEHGMLIIVVAAAVILLPALAYFAMGKE